MYRVLHDLDWAVLVQVSPNEIALDQKHPDTIPPQGRDPVKFRMGSWSEDIFGWFSGDRLEGDRTQPTRREKLGLKLVKDPGDRNVFSVSLQRPNTTDDANMVRVVEMYHNEIKFLVPTNLGASNTPSFLRSQNGAFEVHQQGDGNLVLYDVRTSPWIPLWASGTVTP